MKELVSFLTISQKVKISKKEIKPIILEKGNCKMKRGKNEQRMGEGKEKNGGRKKVRTTEKEGRTFSTRHYSTTAPLTAACRTIYNGLPPLLWIDRKSVV